MIYKKHELSQSLNGDSIIYIARNAAGNVVFRETSEEKLKKEIDRSIEEQQRLVELEERKKAEKAKARAERRGLFAPPPEPSEEEAEPVVEDVVIHQASLTRGPDGKFISRSALQEEEVKKKSLWEKLSS